MAMLLSTLVGCGVFESILSNGEEESQSDVVEPNGTNNTNDANADSEEEQAETDENGYLLDAIPEDIDLKNKEVVIVGWTGSEEADIDFKAEATSKDIITKSTYERNAAVQKRLKVKLNINNTIKGTNAARADYIATVENHLNSGVKYDLIACYSQCAANFAMDGHLRDLMEYDSTLDLEMPWWSSEMLESSVVNDKLYFASGSIAASDILQTLVIAVNLDKVATFGVDDPRQLVKNDQWTLEAFKKMCKGVGANTNEDDPNKDALDEFGFTTMDTVVGDAFFSGVGYKYIVTDSTGKLTLFDEFTGVVTDNLLTDLMATFSGQDYMYAAGFATFEEQRTLLYGTSFWQLYGNIAKLGEFSYGYVPFPKYDTYQERYYSISGFPFTMWGITTACTDEEADDAAYVMEALASEGYRRVQPAVYSSIKTKIGDDVVNKEMFDIIVFSKSYDMGRIFHNVFAWADSPVALFRARFYNGFEDGQGWSSLLAEHQEALNTGVNSINGQFGY